MSHILIILTCLLVNFYLEICLKLQLVYIVENIASFNPDTGYFQSVSGCGVKARNVMFPGYRVTNEQCINGIERVSIAENIVKKGRTSKLIVRIDRYNTATQRTG